MAIKQSKYSRLSLAERKLIEQHNKSGKSVRWIAKALGRSKSTISCELRRGGRDSPSYRHRWAHKNALISKERNRKKRKITGALETLILYHMFEYHSSPKQISGRLKRQYPTLSELHISHETIYRFIYRSQLKEKIISCLRRKGKRKASRSGFQRGGIKNKTSIHMRPNKVENREEIGHWEGDLIIGKEQKSAMGTLVERSSRYVILIPLKNRGPSTVRKEFTDAFKQLPLHLRKSLTYDQGIEMAQHEKFTKETGVPVYFADPASPYQRGSNENINGLVREYFPKKTDLKNYTSEEVAMVQNILNSRPKIILGYATPKEILNASIKNSTTKLSQLVSSNF